MSKNPYTSQAISGYNSSPPPDDGSQTAANKTTWSGVKTKLSDPVKTLSEAVNSAINTALGTLPLYSIANKTIAYVIQDGDNNKIVAWNATATGTIAVPSATGITTGFSCKIFHNANGNGLTLSSTGTATHALNGTVNGTVFLGPYQSGDLFCDAANWSFMMGGTATGSGTAEASQAQMEAATATGVMVTPASIIYSPYAAKAMLKISNAGSYVSSINATATKSANGRFTVTWGTAFSSTNYYLSAMGLYTGTDTVFVSYASQFATGVEIRTAYGSNSTSLVDAGFTLIVFGDQ